MKYNIAGLNVEYDAKYKKLEERSKKYLQDKNISNIDFGLRLSDKTIEKELQRECYKNNKEDVELAEYMIIGSTFYKVLIKYNGLLLHSSAVVVDNEAYLFSAPCGTGKSTHTGLWIKYLKDKNPYILNDDKPAIRIIDNEIYAFGTPFSGKYDISQNKQVKLKAICFLERAEENFIKIITAKEALPLFWQQTINNLNEHEISMFFDTLEIILDKIPIYKFGCNISEDAVKLSYNTMRGENTDEN